MSNEKKRTVKIRNYLEELLKGCKTGTIIFSDEISASLSKQYRSITCKDVGMAMRERDDIENKSSGVWVKK